MEILPPGIPCHLTAPWDIKPVSFGTPIVLAIWMVAMVALSLRRRPRHLHLVFPIITILLIAPLLLPYFGYIAVIEAAAKEHGGVERLAQTLVHLLNLGFGVVAIITAFAFLYRSSGIKPSSRKPDEEDDIVALVDCFYFSTIVWTTVGFGDIVPSGRLSRIIAMYEALLGYFTLGVAVGEFTQLGAALFHTAHGSAG